MHKSDLYTLFRYNQWANGRILIKAAKLTPAQLTEPINLARESLYETLIHIYDAEWSWRLACQEGAMPGVMLTSGSWPNFEAFRKSWKEEMGLMLAFVEALNETRINKSHEYIWTARAKPRQLTLWKILLHIANHGIHHRAEIGRHLTTLGQSPKDMDFIIWASRHAKED
jgi:uncharacterized damage-inducible protein DinB